MSDYTEGQLTVLSTASSLLYERNEEDQKGEQSPARVRPHKPFKEMTPHEYEAYLRANDL